ncbi:MAG: N-acetylmuramoyl-L-alanine amidase AmiD [Burkholderia gladioli]|nr:MAG: N-acetylmuramoyl-L-alanine amidase AmiD [Burkholderia gladioli]
MADTSHPAQGADSRVRFLVMHYTESDDSRALFVLTQNEVSAHYLIPSHPARRNGEPVVLQLVPESQRAWHAGVIDWQGTTELNAASIGIEIVNAGPLDAPADRTWQPYAPDQVEAVVKLAKDIVARYGIPPTRVVGHSDIAPQRNARSIRARRSRGWRCTVPASVRGPTTPPSPRVWRAVRPAIPPTCAGCN